MTIHTQNACQELVIGIVLVVLFIIVPGRIPVHAQVSATQSFVGIVSNMNGEARLHSAALGRQPQSKEVTLQETVVYGDRVETKQDSTLSMLVGDGTLVSMNEHSEVALEQTQHFPGVIQLMRGETCVSTKRRSGDRAKAVPVKTPTMIVRPIPGAMFRASFRDLSSEQAATEQRPQHTLTEFAQHNQGVFSPANRDVTARKRVETIEVLHGRVTIESQFGGFSPLTVYERYRVEVTDGKIGPQSKVSAPSCENQDLQKTPQHTTNPKELRQYIAQQHSTQANGLVAALFTPDAGIDSTPSAPGWTGIIISTTASDISSSISNENVVEIQSQGPVESNTSTLVLTNTDIGIGGSDDIHSLVSVSSGGLLRGTSTDPVISIQNSQTATQSAVEIIDASLLEASAPLIAALSADSTSPVASQITTTGDAVQITGSQLVASLPADALALVELDGSSLFSSGSLFDVTGGGTLAVNGNLVSLSNGSQLGADSLVALSGGSSFGLTGGSLLFGDSSSTAAINNTLCAGGGCTNGFVSAPSGNTISIAPNFQPTQGIDVSPDAALIVVNGTGNSVVLQ